MLVFSVDYGYIIACGQRGRLIRAGKRRGWTHEEFDNVVIMKDAESGGERKSFGSCYARPTLRGDGQGLTDEKTHKDAGQHLVIDIRFKLASLLPKASRLCSGRWRDNLRKSLFAEHAASQIFSCSSSRG